MLIRMVPTAQDWAVADGAYRDSLPSPFAIRLSE